MIPEDPASARRRKDRDELTAELVRLLGEIESREDALRAYAKEERERIRDLRALVKERRAQLAERRGSQVVIPGAFGGPEKGKP